MKTKTSQGFTIIETLVAITILMIAIVGPLTIAHKGLLASIYASQQITATYLAMDAIEYIKNMRDNNILIAESVPGRDWLYGLSSGPTVCTQADPCSVDTYTGDPTQLVSDSGVLKCGTGVNACRFNLDTYGYDYLRGTPSPYYRYFYIENPAGSLDYEAKMVVVVKWKNGTVDNVFTFENEIFNVIR